VDENFVKGQRKTKETTEGIRCFQRKGRKDP
jgi:hypothetical protein